MKDSKVLILGFTFKEDCPDVRNTKVIDIVTELSTYGIDITIHDPWANPDEVIHEYGVQSHTELNNNKFDAVILAVSHKEFMKLNFTEVLNDKAVFYDVKGCIEGDFVDSRL